ncbi:MAG: hypothetical protein LBF92_08235 [Synergistaceae bacterium]|nr:hypothetical protein [Synergistaceae bacterium]
MTKDIEVAIITELDRALDIAEAYFVLKQKDIIPYSTSRLNNNFIAALDEMSAKCSKATTGFTNLITSLAIKAALGDSVDIRYHQTQIQSQTDRPAGFNFRGVSEKVIYFWLSTHEFVCAKSGWQTRTFERPKPYMLNYDENIGDIKDAFLTCYDQIEGHRQDALAALVFLLWRQLQLRDAMRIALAIPTISDVLQITGYFQLHFNHRYSDTRGASRLPVLALYSLYEVLVKELNRYDGKTLKPLEAHSAADSRTGALGDIEVVNPDGTIFEVLEIKHGIAISKEIVESVKRKIRGNSVSRYYVLTTHNQHEPNAGVFEEIENIKKSLGCQLIVNGVIPSIRYYLRMLSNPCLVFPLYADLLSTDTAIAFEHKDAWNKIAIGDVR